MNRGQPVPIFIQVAETIRGRIINNLYPPGTLIPSARELEDEFGVSNITIRKALGLLAKEELILPKRGVGTQVANRQLDLVEIEITGNFQSWMESAAGRRYRITTHVLETAQVPCPDRVRDILSLDPDSDVWRMKRVRLIGNRPISYFINFAPLKIGRMIHKRQVESHSFIEVFQDVCGVRLSRMEQKVQAVVADIDLSRTLDVSFGAPLFFVENLYFNDKQTPIEVTHMYYRGDRYAYKASIDL